MECSCRRHGAQESKRWNRTFAGLVGGVVIVLAAPTALAEQVEITFSATLDATSCSSDCIGALGATITGTWVFENAAAGSGTNPTVYPLQSIDFATAHGAVGGATGGTISIANDLSAPPTDGYTVGGTGVFGNTTTSPSVPLTALSVQLLDTNGTVFGDTSLPAGAPPLVEFESARVFTSFNNGLTTWNAVWNITSLSATVICPGLADGALHSTLNEQIPTSPPFTNRSSGQPTANSTYGWRFRPTIPGLVVSRLGVDSAISGSLPQTLTLFDFATQTVLAQGTSSPGAGWRWVDVVPVPLQMGRDYVVAGHGTVNAWAFYDNRTTIGSSWFPTSPIEYVEARLEFNVSDSVVFPSLVGADFQGGLVDVGYASTACVVVPGTGIDSLVDSTLGLPGQSFDLFVPDHGMLLDLDVALRLRANGGVSGSATWWDDLRITLRKGTRSFVLNANPGANTNGLFDVTFDSSAITSIATLKGGDALGSVRPDGPVQDPFDGVMLGGRWTLNFEDTCCTNDSVLEGWELYGQVMEEPTTLTCAATGTTGGDRLEQRGVRFLTDRPFQGVRLDLSASVPGTYRFDAELRRSTGFTGPTEATTTMEVALANGTSVSTPIYFDGIPVSGADSFTLKFTNVTGPGFAFFDTFGIGNEPCPNVEETNGNTSATPTVRSDPSNFRVVAVPEPTLSSGLVMGVLLLIALGSGLTSRSGRGRDQGLRSRIFRVMR